MRDYQRCWVAAWAPFAVVGLWAAFVAWSVVAMLLLLLASAAATALPVAVLIRSGRHRTGFSVEQGIELRDLPTPAALGGGTVVAMAGLAAILGPAAWLLLFAAAATSPATVAMARRRLRPDAPDPVAGPLIGNENGQIDSVEIPPAAAVSSMTNTELCTAWRTSYRALQAATTCSRRSHLVALRQAYLDEFERRNPHGLTAWLNSGARAAGNPVRYLTRGH